MTKLRRLAALVLGAFWISIAAAAYTLRVGHPEFSTICGCIFLFCGIVFLGLALVPWGDEP